MTPAYEHVLLLPGAERAGSLRVIYRMERAVAAAALVLLSPLLIPVAAAIAILSRRTPLVRHTRVGFRGADLPVLKLRTMWQRGQPWGPLFAIEDVSSHVPHDKCDEDARVTSPFAAWLRRYSIDELPQLLHVARGEMSLVGPRPITRAELGEHYGPYSDAVLSVRPGLTGLWQMLGRSHLSYAKRRRLDLWFVRFASPGLYFRILFRSIPKVLRGHGAY